MKYDRGRDVWGIYTGPGIQPQQILETTATQTQGKETATEYNTVIPPAHAYIPPPS
jgi:hypothetical protein